MGPRKLNWGQAYWTSSAEAGTWFLRRKGWRSLHTPAFCSDFLHSRVKEFQKWDLLGIMRDPKSFLKIEIYMRLFHSKGWPAEALRHCFPPKLWGCHVALIQALHGGTLPQVMLQLCDLGIFATIMCWTFCPSGPLPMSSEPVNNKIAPIYEKSWTN